MFHKSFYSRIQGKNDVCLILIFFHIIILIDLFDLLIDYYNIHMFMIGILKKLNNENCAINLEIPELLEKMTFLECDIFYIAILTFIIIFKKFYIKIQILKPKRYLSFFFY